ncbi:hypothetical protein TESG_08649 [Trichophyton tonsurans CBS 112818]|uniref:Uncharacterized protein n=1 Tax=Trichophyton tonsurans (strain CBS 112818) TaxID=647933 RepID=F2SA75_TRIT1|nr:hypothetical protein TESG_08649 [Trichophyton tonsurans CBS 112818]
MYGSQECEDEVITEASQRAAPESGVESSPPVHCPLSIHPPKPERVQSESSQSPPGQPLSDETSASHDVRSQPARGRETPAPPRWASRANTAAGGMEIGGARRLGVARVLAARVRVKLGMVVVPIISSWPEHNSGRRCGMTMMTMMPAAHPGCSC